MSDDIDWVTFRTHPASTRRHLARFSRLRRPVWQPACDIGTKAKHRVDSSAFPDLDEALGDINCSDCEAAARGAKYGMLAPPAVATPDPRAGERPADVGTENGTVIPLFPADPADVVTDMRNAGLIETTSTNEVLTADVLFAAAFDQPPPTPPGPDSIATQFSRFHTANPGVYNGLVRLARQAKAAGRDRIGIGMLFEVLRWEWITGALSPDDEAWKLNNNYRSRYARLIQEREPDLTDIFETRTLRSE